MAGSLQARIKTWVSTEDVEYDDLNAEFDNVLTAMQPLLIDDYSTNATQMQVTADPGESGTESLATTLAGELARLRFVLKEIKGNVTYWYSSSSTSLSDLRAAVGTGIPNNRIASGAISANSNQAKFLTAAGSSAACTIEGTPTNLVYYVRGTQYTLSADLAVSGLVAAPSSNNTCLVNDAAAVDQQETMWWGEYGTSITVDAMGSEITSLVGKLAGFKVNDGSSDEYFIAFVESSTKLNHARRGLFFNSAGTAVKRIAFADNDVITLLKLTYVFLKTDGTAAVTYNQPTYGPVAPSSPSVGDYWFDSVNDYWKTFNSVAWVDATAILVGMTVQDSSNCIGSRAVDPFGVVSAHNEVELELKSTTEARVKNIGSGLSVNGSAVKYESHRPIWDITADLDSGVTEAAHTVYFMYVKENGDQVMSNIAPHDNAERLGFYHPTETWRCVGFAYNDQTQNLVYAVGYRHTDNESPVADPDPIPKNFAQNAEFRFWQRQVPGTLTNRQDDAYGPDRWYFLTSGGAVNCQGARVAESFIASPTLYVGQFRNADATNRRFGIAQILENDHAIELRGKTVTFSFWARTDSTEITALRAGVVEWTGTADSVTSDIVSSWAATPTLIANAAFLNTPADLTVGTSMRQYTITANVGATMNNLVLFIWTSAEEAQNDDFYVTQVQLVEGTRPQPWENVRKEHTEDFLECQRFYEKTYAINVAPGTGGTGTGVYGSFTASASYAPFLQGFKSRKRTTPTVRYWDAAGNISRVSWFNSGSLAQTDNQNSVNTTAIWDWGLNYAMTNPVGAGAFPAIHFDADAEL